jgi:hypothetical protein
VVELAERHQLAGVATGDGDDLGPLAVGGPACRQLGDRRLDDLAHLEQLGDEGLAIVAGHVDLRQPLGDDGAVPAPLDVAGGDEALDRLAHRGAGDAELLAQHPLRRQRRTGCQLTGQDRVGEALTDLGRHRPAADRVERRRRDVGVRWVAVVVFDGAVRHGTPCSAGATLPGPSTRDQPPWTDGLTIAHAPPAPRSPDARAPTPTTWPRRGRRAAAMSTTSRPRLLDR